MICGGSPCQDFSRGNAVRDGLQGEKSSLFYEYFRLLKELKPTEASVRSIANAFEAYRLYDYVVSAYERGGKMLHNEMYFSFELAQAHLNQGDVVNAVKFYLIN